MQPKKSRGDEQTSDAKYDPYSDARDLYHQEQQAREQEAAIQASASSGIDQREPHLRDNAPSDNTDLVREREKNPMNYDENTPHRSEGQRGIRKFTSKLTGKKAPATGLIGGIAALLFGFGVFIAPSLSIVHLKEVFTEDLNDQVAAMDIRSNHVFRAKLKNFGKSFGSCTGVKFRCGIQGMSNRQIRAFERAGIEVETTGKKHLGKNGIAKLTFTSSSGQPVEVTNPKQLNRRLIDKNIANQLRRAYNPVFYGLWDNTAGKILRGKYNSGKSSRLTGTTKEDLDKSLNQSIAGENVDPEPRYLSSDTNAEEETKKLRQEANKSLARIANSGGASSILSGGLKGVSATGFADSACTVYNTSRAVEAGAKIIRAAQLVGFAMVYLNVADKIKASAVETEDGATPEEVEYVGNKITEIDEREKIVNETSKDTSTPVDNPDYGKSALDSEGARAAFYNDAPDLTARAQQFMVGGALVGTLAVVNNKVESVLGKDNVRSNCKIIQHPVTRIGSGALGLFGAVGSGGATLAISVGASLAFAAALPLLEGYLKDMLAGETVDENTANVDTGNAIFSGTGVLLGDMAMARGMQPASEEMLASYHAEDARIKREYIAMGIEDAKSTPFDVMNQYSFAGVAARKLLPTYSSSKSTVAKLPSLIGTSFASIIPKAVAVGDYNPDRFKKCNDKGYEELNIDADIFCNVRYVMSPTELALETDDVYGWMYDKGYVDEEGEAISGSLYEDFLENCVNRVDGWGSTTEENGDIGEDCVDYKKSAETKQRLSRFRVFTMDRSIEEGMENGPVIQVSSSSGNEAGDSGSLNQNYAEPNYKKNPAVQVDEPGSRCTGSFTPGAQSLSSVIKNQWPIVKTIGGYSCRANTGGPGLSVHAVGRAIDIMVNANTSQGLKAGNEMRNWLINNARPLGVQRVIWNRHIWSADQDGWRPYSGSSPHTDHIHAEVNISASKNPNLGKSGVSI